MGNNYNDWVGIPSTHIIKLLYISSLFILFFFQYNSIKNILYILKMVWWQYFELRTRKPNVALIILKVTLKFIYWYYICFRCFTFFFYRYLEETGGHHRSWQLQPDPYSWRSSCLCFSPLKWWLNFSQTFPGQKKINLLSYKFLALNFLQLKLWLMQKDNRDDYRCSESVCTYYKTYENWKCH